MKLKEIIFPVLFFLLVTVVFFHKAIFSGLVPFPGDLLVAEYQPWKSYSYLGYVKGSYPNKAQYFDTLRQFYPWKTFSISQVKNGEFPLWNPYNFSGTPLFANFQSSILYPLSFLYFLLPQILTWTLLIMIQPFLAGIFTYFFCREIGLRKESSYLSAISFACCLFMTSFLEYSIIGNTILWLPLGLLAVERLFKKWTSIEVIILSLSISFSFLAGHLQIFGFSFLFIISYAFYKALVLQKSKKFITILGILVLAVFVCSVQLFPTVELIQNSAHGSQQYQFLIEKLLIQPFQLILFLSPDIFGNPATNNYLISDTYPGNALYIGLIPFLFALFAFVSSKKSSTKNYFIGISIILLFFFLRTPFTEMFYRLQIPFFSTSSPTNAIFLLSLSLSILAGFGMDDWFEKKNKRRIYIMGGTIVFLLLSGLIFYRQHIVSQKNFTYSLGLLTVFAILFFIGERIKKKKLALLFIVITVFDLFYFSDKFNPFVPHQLVFPQAPVAKWLSQESGINRVWGYGAANIESNFQTQLSIFSPDGYDPLYSRRYGEFIQSTREGVIETGFTNQTRSDATIAEGFGQNGFVENNKRLQILNLLGVMYILDREENGSTQNTFPPSIFETAYKKDGWTVFKNKEAAPRFFLTSNYVVVHKTDEFQKALFNKSFDPSKTILLEEDPNLPTKELKESSIHLNTYQPNKVSFSTESNGSKLLFLSDSYYPGWKSFIDGKEVKILRADYAFRAVLVPSGSHTVEFDYLPESFFLGIKTSIISLVVLFIVIIFTKRWIKL